MVSHRVTSAELFAAIPHFVFYAIVNRDALTSNILPKMSALPVTSASDLPVRYRQLVDVGTSAYNANATLRQEQGGWCQHQ
jgi:hypothetical protein